jgi:hypothetical protein
MTKSAERAPESTIDLGCRIAISAAMINVSSPIYISQRKKKSSSINCTRHQASAAALAHCRKAESIFAAHTTEQYLADKDHGEAGEKGVEEPGADFVERHPMVSVHHRVPLL